MHLYTDIDINTTHQKYDVLCMAHQKCGFRPLTCDELPHLGVHRLPQQAQQGRHAARVPHGHFVFVHVLAIDEVPQSSTGVPLDLQHFVVEEVDQVLDPSQPTHLHAETCLTSNTTVMSFHADMLVIYSLFVKHVLKHTFLGIRPL